MSTVGQEWDPRQMRLAVMLHELVCVDARLHGWVQCPDAAAVGEATAAAWNVLRLSKPKDLNAEVNRLLG